MLVKRFDNTSSLAQAAAEHATAAMQSAIGERDYCRIIVATAASQFPFLEKLTAGKELDWNKVEAFHLDEYVGLPATHPGSFRKMLLERVAQKTTIQKYHPIEGDAKDLPATLRDLGTLLNTAPIDIAFVGIGENAHIAFNDPPADFGTETPYIIVELDEACRRQQVGEGWFESISQVPTHAISMSARQILKAREIIAIVPDERKAQAVKATLEKPVSEMVPASILRRHPNATLYLDRNSASLLSLDLLQRLERDPQVTIGF
jgi:glucosamine-6-phosphate deaminase